MVPASGEADEGGAREAQLRTALQEQQQRTEKVVQEGIHTRLELEGKLAALQERTEKVALPKTQPLLFGTV